MVELIADISKRLLISVFITAVISFFFRSLLAIGESSFQSFVVLSFYLYCGISLFTYSRFKLFYVLSLPVLTQFIHIFQKYSFTTGANSVWRILPFLILNAYFIYFFSKKTNRPNHNYRVLLLSWIIIHLFFLIISPNLERIIWGGITLYLITLPLLFSYLQLAAAAGNFRSEIEIYLTLLFVIVGVGTFGLVIAGAGYKGSDNLLATRNIADTNVTMAYFILLWPFVLLYTHRHSLHAFFKMPMLFIFAGAIILSFSRGAVLLLVPYLLATIFLTRNFIKIKWILLTVISGIIYRPALARFLEGHDITYFWRLRFADISTVDSLLSKLESVSGRSEIHHIAYTLFLRSPLTGHGTGSFEILGPGYREAHSMWYTLLAEEGITGAIFMYSLFIILFLNLSRLASDQKKYRVLVVSLIFYLIFNHTVGSTFVILPGKSISVNCIAPVLLLCMHFYAASAPGKEGAPLPEG